MPTPSSVSPRPRMLVVGSGGHARVVIDILRLRGEYEVLGCLDRFRDLNAEIDGLRVLGNEDDLPALSQALDLAAVMVAVGDNHTRAGLVSRIQALCPTLRFATAVHPAASVAPTACLGEGSVVCAGAVVCAHAQVGAHAIVNTRASLDHDSELGPFSSLAPGVVVSGRCQIGAESAVGAGAVLIHQVTVGAHTVVGAGALVMRPIPDRVVAYGHPARVVRTREPNDRYL